MSCTKHVGACCCGRVGGLATIHRLGCVTAAAFTELLQGDLLPTCCSKFGYRTAPLIADVAAASSVRLACFRCRPPAPCRFHCCHRRPTVSTPLAAFELVCLIRGQCGTQPHQNRSRKTGESRIGQQPTSELLRGMFRGRCLGIPLPPTCPPAKTIVAKADSVGRVDRLSAIALNCRPSRPLLANQNHCLVRPSSLILRSACS